MEQKQIKNNRDGILKSEAPFRRLTCSGQNLFIICCALMGVFLVVLLFQHFRVLEPLYREEITTYGADFYLFGNYYLKIINPVMIEYADNLIWSLTVFLAHAVCLVFFLDAGVSPSRRNKRYQNRFLLSNHPVVCVVLIGIQLVLSYYIIVNFYPMVLFLYTFTISVPLAMPILLSMLYILFGKAWYALLTYFTKGNEA